MNRIFLLALAVAVLTAASDISGQSPESKEAEQLAALVKELHAQQAQITDNQSKIDAKMADLSEAIRVARLFAAKAGK